MVKYLQKIPFKEGEMKYISAFVKAVFAGIVVGIAGFMYCRISDKNLGSLLFTFALFMVVTCGFFLFTGKDGYIFENPPSYLIILLITWIGNFAGTWLVAALTNLTRMSAMQTAVTFTEARMSDSLISLFILGIFCNLLMFFGVDGYKKIPHEAGKYIVLFLSISIFILCGFEHCVADMFYFCAARMINAGTMLRLLVITAGNMVGAVLLPLGRKLFRE